jgi:hypothetical protein
MKQFQTRHTPEEISNLKSQISQHQDWDWDPDPDPASYLGTYVARNPPN